jgi:hypothetical protein
MVVLMRSWQSQFSCGAASRNLNLPESIADYLLFLTEHGNHAMGTALQINFALWVMIGCATEKAVQFIQYLN